MELTLADGSKTACRLENLSAGGACLRQPPEDWQSGREVAFTSVAGADGTRTRGPAAAAAVRQAIRRLLESRDRC